MNDRCTYEEWAKKAQKAAMERTATLVEVVTAIQNYVPVCNDTMIAGMKSLVENVFGITSGEMNRLIDGKEYWIR